MDNTRPDRRERERERIKSTGEIRGDRTTAQARSNDQRKPCSPLSRLSDLGGASTTFYCSNDKQLCMGSSYRRTFLLSSSSRMAARQGQMSGLPWSYAVVRQSIGGLRIVGVEKERDEKRILGKARKKLAYLWELPRRGRSTLTAFLIWRHEENMQSCGQSSAFFFFFFFLFREKAWGYKVINLILFHQILSTDVVLARDHRLFALFALFAALVLFAARLSHLLPKGESDGHRAVPARNWATQSPEPPA